MFARRFVLAGIVSFVAAFFFLRFFLYSLPILFVPLFTPFLPSSLLSSVICFSFSSFVRSFVRSCGDAGSRSACALCVPRLSFPVCNARLLSVNRSTFAPRTYYSFLSFLFLFFPLSSLVSRGRAAGNERSVPITPELTETYRLVERGLATRHHLTSKTDNRMVFANRDTERLRPPALLTSP